MEITNTNTQVRNGVKIMDIRMDSHKLMFHPTRVSAWLQGKTIYPIEMEVGLSGACNHRCIFCAIDYLEYAPIMLDADVLLQNIAEIAPKGLKSIIYSGEGEPLLHKRAAEIINKTKSLGVDTAIATNGVLLTKEMSEECLASITWIRCSIAGATEQTYQTIHQSKTGDLEKVLTNLAAAVDFKHKNKLTTTLGGQLLLLPENKQEVISLAKILKNIGLDYFTVKPFSQHPQSKVKLNVDYSEAEEINRELQEYNSENFKIYFRSQAMENLLQEKKYSHCAGLNFMTHLDAYGKVFPCIVFVGDKELCYGNIYQKSFTELWESKAAEQLRQMFAGDFIKNNCRKTCRLDEINKYLYELKNPNEHVNFI